MARPNPKAHTSAPVNVDPPAQVRSQPPPPPQKQPPPPPQKNFRKPDPRTHHVNTVRNTLQQTQPDRQAYYNPIPDASAQEEQQARALEVREAAITNAQKRQEQAERREVIKKINQQRSIKDKHYDKARAVAEVDEDTFGRTAVAEEKKDVKISKSFFEKNTRKPDYEKKIIQKHVKKGAYYTLKDGQKIYHKTENIKTQTNETPQKWRGDWGYSSTSAGQKQFFYNEKWLKGHGTGFNTIPTKLTTGKWGRKGNVNVPKIKKNQKNFDKHGVEKYMGGNKEVFAAERTHYKVIFDFFNKEKKNRGKDKLHKTTSSGNWKNPFRE